VASKPRPLDPALRDVLTRPREAGTPAVAAAREVVTDRLRALGYTVEIHRFRFHPSTLWAFPVFGAGLGWLSLVLVPLLISARVPAWAGAAAWLAGAVSLGALAFGVGSGAAPLALAGGVREDANLLATRSAEVRCWIVAHVDTKAQGHSMAGRLMAVWFSIAAVLALTGLALARLAAPLALWVALSGALLAIVAGLLAGRGRLLGQSPGVRDNGSGVAAALTAAEVVRDPRVGIVITGAEEFGLLGARMLVRDRRALFAGSTVVNLDTLDETGRIQVVGHNAAGHAAARAAAAALEGLHLPITVRRLPLGILVDSLPFASAGAAAVTIARLDWSTLRRLHTPRDSAHGCAFETAVRVGEAIAGRFDVFDSRG
jgi:peptidase M28-like protein